MPEIHGFSMDTSHCQVNFSVAIPTYNGEQRLATVLERLSAQVGTEHLVWEIIVVDNRSTDHTAKVVQEYQAKWLHPAALKYVYEGEPGAAFARQRAVEVAQGHWIGFLDDDNLPDEHWVANAYAFGVAHPKVGAYGSQIHGEFELPPPANFKEIACYLAIVERGSTPHQYNPKNRVLPPGAGLVVRRDAWLDCVPKRLFLNHTSKEAGLASEDLEALMYMQQAGWEMWYNPAMVVYHKIPSWRLEKPYLLSLMRCIGLSCHHLRMMGAPAWKKPLKAIAHFILDSQKVLVYFLKYRHQIDHDLIAACKWQLLISRLISPFFLWKKYYFSKSL